MIVKLPISRGLLSPLTVAAITGRDEDAILKLVEGGELEFAFNIGGLARAARCMRIATLSVADFVNGQKSPRTLGEVLRAILPGAGEVIQRTDVARYFSCSPAHAAKLFPVQCNRGPNGSPAILRAEVTSFLQQRRIL
jgi:hypothetical protein